MSVGITIAIDAMSGDDGPEIVVPAALAYLQKKAQESLLSIDSKTDADKAFNIILVGDQDKLGALLFDQNNLDKVSNASPGFSSSSKLPSNLSIVHAETVVEMHDRPSIVLRQKRDSSMAVALQLVKDGKADACVSAGNTGALMILGRAIFVLDLGANVDSSAEHLLQFAIMGQLLAKIIKGIERPKVALLNVGGESIKGNEQVRLAASLIEDSELVNYVGFAEGGDIFRSKADVIVCDGFVGNVALKSAEGAAKILLKEIKDFFQASWYRKLMGFLLLPLLKKHLKQLDPDTHNGAIFLGLQGVLVKSHGHATIRSFEHAIDLAVKEAEENLPEMINKQLESLIF